MAINPPFPSVSDIIDSIGAAGKRLCAIDACEGAAGNISCYCGWDIDCSDIFPNSTSFQLSKPIPEVAGGTFIVSGSGRRLRELGDSPERNLGAVVISKDGASAELRTSDSKLFERLTSEFNSHLAVHVDYISRTGGNFHALVHAQPVHITYLSHIPEFQDETYLNRHILRWEPESIINMPEGVGLVPFAVPGSELLEQGTVENLRKHKLVIWAKHGVVARSEASVKRACDLIEYAETGARYEYMNMVNGAAAEGLTREEILLICKTFSIEQSVF